MIYAIVISVGVCKVCRLLKDVSMSRHFFSVLPYKAVDTKAWSTERQDWADRTLDGVTRCLTTRKKGRSRISTPG